MIQLHDIHWFAGLLEGEGYFAANQGIRVCPAIKLAMTDHDIVARAATLFNNERIGETAACGNKKRMFRTAVYGVRAASWMMTLYPLMGQRRQERIRDALTAWKAAPRRPYMTANSTRTRSEAV